VDDDLLGAWRGFLNAHAHITRRISKDLAAAGLPDLSWYDLLWAIYDSPGKALRVNELARAVVLSPTAMSRFVDRVEKAGYVRRTTDPDDRRALQIEITPAGVDLLREMWPIYRKGIEEYFGTHVGRSAARTRAMLERLTQENGAPEAPR
jgi:DNA-binding MarR family transcriptional regulator